MGQPNQGPAEFRIQVTVTHKQEEKQRFKVKDLEVDTEKTHRATAVPPGSWLPFLSSITRSFSNKNQSNSWSGKADVPARSFFFSLTEATLAKKGLPNRSLSFLGALDEAVNMRSWMEKCNQNINKGPWWKKAMTWYVPPPTTCSGVWLMGHLLGNVRHTEAAGRAHRRRPQCWNRTAPSHAFCSRWRLTGDYLTC